MKLDIGCGHLESHEKRADLGIDIKKGKCDIIGDAHFLPFKNCMFQTVFFYDVIEHVKSPLECLREIHRVLKENGKLEISTPNPLHWRKFLRLARKQKLELSGREHIATWTHIEMEILLEQAGFVNARIFYTILNATKKYDSRKHIILDTIAYRLLPCEIAGRNMIASVIK